MALDFNVEDLLKWAKDQGFKVPKVDPYAPRQVGKREYHKSPGHRSWTETWVYPQRPQPGDDFEKYHSFDHHVTHQGTDFIWRAEFWEEVEMLTGEEATVEELREKMNGLDREAVEAGYRHYYDKFTWEDSSERVRRLRDAFEAEHLTPSGMRIYDKAARFVNDAAIAAAYGKISKMDLKDFLLLDDSIDNMGLIAA